jgi:hypothetical protein
MKAFIKENEIKISRIAIIIIFLALIRCIVEIFRLEHYAGEELSYREIKPFIASALVGAIGLFLMVGLYFLARYKVIPMIAATIVVLLVVLKYAC